MGCFLSEHSIKLSCFCQCKRIGFEYFVDFRVKQHALWLFILWKLRIPDLIAGSHPNQSIDLSLQLVTGFADL